MKGFVKLTAAVIVILTAIFILANLMLHGKTADSSGRPYRVEAERIALRLEKGEAFDPSDYKYITAVVPQNNGFEEENSDYLVKEIGGMLYRFDYSYSPDSGRVVLICNICLAVISVFVLGLLMLIYFKIIRPFRKLSSYPAELARGTLTVPLRDSKDGYFGKFLWGLDLLRETLENRRSTELALQQKNKTMVLSLSHDIKTPLGLIKLYSKALEKGLYKDEQKKLEIVRSITEKCEDIRSYVDDIVKTSSDDIIDAEVTNEEFYLSRLMNDITSFYKDKLELLKTELTIEDHPDCILNADFDRSVEVLQNIMENAIKYGDGRRISVFFSREEDCQLIHILNSGCTLSGNELPHIFDSFWRGSNVGSNAGSGLGLYICRTLMRKMNGDIYADIDGENMVISVVFPMA